MKRCRHCNTPISPTSRAHAKFCNNRCRNAYHNQMARGFRDAAERRELTWSSRAWAISLFRERRESVYDLLEKTLGLGRKEAGELERASRGG